MTFNRIARRILSVAVILPLAWTTPASAGLILSKVIVDLPADAPQRDDIEVWNNGAERMYVVAEPAQIVDPGKSDEHRVEAIDPTASGLLVSPQKLVLEPDERKLVRVASIRPADSAERVYRIAIKPVAGSVQSAQTALKVFVGYDALVIVRPAAVTGDVTAARNGRTVTFHNGSNTSVEMSDGKQCGGDEKVCDPLPAKRLYAGADWTVPLRYDTPVSYRISIGTSARTRTFAP